MQKDGEREDRIHREVVVDAYDSEERAMGWYYYLQDRMQFPFTASCRRARLTSPLEEGVEVEVIALAPEAECQHEMFVLIPWDRRNLAVPLSQLACADDVDEETAEAVSDWHYWFDRGYEF